MISFGTPKSTLKNFWPRRIPAPPPSLGSMPRIELRKQLYTAAGFWNMFGACGLKNAWPKSEPAGIVGLLCRELPPTPGPHILTAFSNAEKVPLKPSDSPSGRRFLTAFVLSAIVKSYCGLSVTAGRQGLHTEGTTPEGGAFLAYGPDQTGCPGRAAA